MTTSCDTCGAESEKVYRCSECGKDLTEAGQSGGEFR